MKKIIYPDVKDAIYKIVNAWSKVSNATIRHCWQHVDICRHEVIIEDNLIVSLKHKEIDKIIIHDLYAYFDKFKYISKSETCTVEEYNSFEDNESTGERLTDEDIIELVRNKNEEKDEEECEDQKLIEKEKVTYKKALQSIDDVISYFEVSSETSSEDLLNLIKLKEKLNFIKEKTKYKLL
jgi:hypothetical protein